MKKINTKTVATTAVLVALSFVMPYFMPTIVLPFTTFTLFSHVPVIIAMFISPYTAIMACIGTTFAFFLKTTPLVALRAASHIVFIMIGSFTIKNNFGTKGLGIPITGFLLGIVHAVLEITVVVLFFTIVNSVSLTAQYAIVEVGLITLMHHCIDYTVSFVIYKSGVKARLLENKFILFPKKAAPIN